MRGIIKVVTREEYILWLAKQKPNYVQVFPDKDPNAAVKTDSTKTAGVAPAPVVAATVATK